MKSHEIPGRPNDLVPPEELVSSVRPFGVDVASGVEDAPGVKSPGPKSHGRSAWRVEPSVEFMWVTSVYMDLIWINMGLIWFNMDLLWFNMDLFWFDMDLLWFKYGFNVI